MTNNAFYFNNYQQFGYSVKSLGWGSTESQEKRFKALSEVGIDNGDRVLDVGCGFGDLYFYLKKMDAIRIIQALMLIKISYC